MEQFHRLICTCLGIGYTPKGGGTLAAIACCLCWYFARTGEQYGYGALWVTGFILVLGVWSAGKVEDKWGKDSSKVVIDEVAGMCLTLLFIPVRWQYILADLFYSGFSISPSHCISGKWRTCRVDGAS